MLQLNGIDHVVLRVNDLDRMLSFYTSVLGCVVERENPIGIVHLRAGNALIDLVPMDGELGRDGREPPAHHAPNMDHLCLKVEPVDAEKLREHLNSHGISSDVPAMRFGETGDDLSIYLEDPEGNRLELRGFNAA